MLRREAVCSEWHRHEFDGVKRGDDVTCPTCNEVYTLNKRNNNALYGWRIVRDYTEPKESEYYIGGKTCGDYQGGKFRYRLKDDDGETYYIIESDVNPDTGTESQLFAPLDWAMNYAGCARIEYKDAETGEYVYL